jgi:2-polyprenyl-3-methyl-5-hydroxy-6-metoxy-1,4-benzoquinol methylase
MKITNCYNCGSKQNDHYAEENGYLLVKCKGCGLLFVENRPDDEEITEAYKQGKHEGEKELDVTGRFNFLKISRYSKVLKELYPDDPDLDHVKKWLDVGCVHGEFMVAIKKMSRDKVKINGSEPNIYKQESARKRGLDVGFFDLATHKQKYDVVSLLSVYSHLPYPPQFLDLLKTLLNPGGEILLETGDTAGLTADEHPRPFLLPGHLSFASEAIIVGILERAGFEILKVKKFPILERSLKSLGIEIVKAFLPNYRSRLKYFISGNIPRTDMYIRARIKG